MAYDLQDLRTRVRSKIKDTSYSSSTVDGFINDAQQEIADLYPWTYFQKVISGALTIGEHTYEQQSDHEITERLILLHPTDTDWYINLTKHYLPHEKFFGLYPAPDTQDNSQPYEWTEYGDQLYFNCPVNIAYVLRQYYRKTPTELSADGDVPELPRAFREALVLGAAYRCEEERDNYDIAAVLRQRFEDKVSDLMVRHSNTTLAAPDTVILPPRHHQEDW